MADTAGNKPKGRRGGLFGCLLAPFALLRRQLAFALVAFALAFGSCAACALLAPISFQAVINSVRSAGLQAYALVLSITGNPALKLVTYEADVSARGQVQRAMGVLGLLYGEGAVVEGTVRVALGADLKNNGFGVLSCDIDTSTIRSSVGRAPLAGTAFDSEAIKQEAFAMFEAVSTTQALDKYWPEARRRLQNQFAVWALGLEIPERPTLIQCPLRAPAPGTAPR